LLFCSDFAPWEARDRAINPRPPTSSTSITIVSNKVAGSKVDVHIGDHASKNKQSAACRKDPADCAFSIPEENTNAEQHWDKRYPKGVGTVEAPIRTDNIDLIRDEISAYAAHDEAHDEVSDSARCTAYVFERSVFHGILAEKSTVAARKKQARLLTPQL
jgi:hypothetical protein